MTTEAQKRANKKYIMNNREKYNEIRRIYNNSIYEKIADQQKEYKKNRYYTVDGVAERQRLYSKQRYKENTGTIKFNKEFARFRNILLD